MTSNPDPARRTDAAVGGAPVASSAATLERPACPLCAPGRDAFAPGVPATDEVAAGRGFAPYGVRSCRACGLHFLCPRLTEAAMQQVYRSDTYFDAGSAQNGRAGRPPTGYDNYAAQAQALRLTFRRFLKALQARGLAGGDLLEVGCGPGLLLDEARPLFGRREGCEFSPAAAARARDVADAVHEGGVESVPPSARYDCIVATQVVEHVYDPRAFVRTLVAHLKPGGVLVLATPDGGSPWRRIMGRRWPSYKLPEHVLYFDASTLSRLMGDSGLLGVQSVPYPHAFPLALVAAKLGLAWRGPGAARALWIPGTTLALAGRVAGRGDGSATMP